MREIVHLQVGQCGNQIGSKVGLIFAHQYHLLGAKGEFLCVCVYVCENRMSGKGIWLNWYGRVTRYPCKYVFFAHIPEDLGVAGVGGGMDCVGRVDGRVGSTSKTWPRLN